MKYEIRTKREIWNTILHIIIGGVIIYVMIPDAVILIAESVIAVVAIVREIIQRLRGKEQPLYIHIIDVLGFMVGAALWVYIRDKKKINADEL